MFLHCLPLTDPHKLQSRLDLFKQQLVREIKNDSWSFGNVMHIISKTFNVMFKMCVNSSLHHTLHIWLFFGSTHICIIIIAPSKPKLTTPETICYSIGPPN